MNKALKERTFSLRLTDADRLNLEKAAKKMNRNGSDTVRFLLALAAMGTLDTLIEGEPETADE